WTSDPRGTGVGVPPRAAGVPGASPSNAGAESRPPACGSKRPSAMKLRPSMWRGNGARVTRNGIEFLPRSQDPVVAAGRGSVERGEPDHVLTSKGDKEHVMRITIAALMLTVLLLGGCGELQSSVPYNGAQSCAGVGGFYTRDARCVIGGGA